MITTHAVAVRLPRAISLLLLQISASLFSTSKAGFEIAPEKQSQVLLAAFPKCCQSPWLPCRAVFHRAVDGSVEEGAARCLLQLQGLCEVMLMASVGTLGWHPDDVACVMMSVTELHPARVTAGDVESWGPSKAFSSDSPIHFALGLISCCRSTCAGGSQVCPRDKAGRKQLQGCFHGSPILSGVVGVCRAVSEGDTVQLGLILVLCPCRKIKEDKL